ncbi:MAG: hypothetical protein EP330_17055 [Deltaproteobacteria bacterium]|nr:MAG: hypothetical protein EP330_17055 [Deltaproteobacteria bacterium]
MSWPVVDFAAAGLVPTTPPEAEQGGRTLAERFDGETLPMGTLWPGETWMRSVERAQGKRLVARGPVFHAGTELEAEGAWFVDAEQPSTLWFAATAEISPLLWIPVEPTVDALRAAIASVRPAAEEAARTERRAWAGYTDEVLVPNVYSGELTHSTVDQLTNYWLFNPFRGGTSMGAYTRCTASFAGLEMHFGEAWVWTLSYVPAPHAAAVQAVNDALGHCAYPLDMPVDLVACLLGFHYLEADELREVFARAADAGEEDTQFGPLLTLLAAVIYGTPALDAELATYAAHPVPLVRRSAAIAAHTYGNEGVLASLVDDPDPSVREVAVDGVHPEAPLVWANPIG